MIEKLKKFLTDTSDFKINSGTIQEVLKLQRRAFATRMNAIEHNDNVNL